MTAGPIEVNVDMSELNEFIDAYPEIVDRAVREGTKDFAVELFNTSQELCPVNTGQLRRSGELKIEHYVFKITYGGVLAPYAASVHFGYKRHWVEPRHKKVLAWPTKGRGYCTPAKSKRGICAFSYGHFVPREREMSTPNPWLFNAIFKEQNGWKTAILKRLTTYMEGIK